MMQITIGDLTNGLVGLIVSLVVLLVFTNALVSRYFRWRVSREPAMLDTFTQAEFDWSWNLTALIINSHLHGLLWALDALNIPLRVSAGDFLNEGWIPAALLLIAYITLFVSTGRTRPSRNAMLLYAGFLAVSYIIAFWIGGMLLEGLDPALLASVYGTSIPLRPGDILLIYAIMGFFVAPDFLLLVALIDMAPLAIGYFVCQLVDAIIKLVKNAARPLQARRPDPGSARDNGEPMPPPME